MRYTVFLVFFFLIFSRLDAQQQLSQTTNERLFQKGLELIAHSNYGAARKTFSEYLERAPVADPRRGEASYYMALSALRLNHGDGEKLIEDFISGYPANPRAGTAYFDLADYYFNEKNYPKASQYYRKTDFPSLTREQQNEGHFKWGYSSFSSKNLDEALAQFNFVKEQSSEFAPASNYYAGFVEFTKGEYDNALKDLSKAESNPSYANVVPFLIANVYYRQKKFDTLLEYARKAGDRKDLANSREFAMLVAEANYFKGDFENAARSYEEYLGDKSVKPETPLLFRAGFANYSLNNIPKAVDYLGRAAASKDSVSYFASYYLGILYLKQGDKQLAINAFEYARKVPNDTKLAEEAAFQYAKVLYDAGRPEQAITDFEKFLATYPGSAHVLEAKELLAQAYVNGNNYHKAIEYIESLPSKNAAIEQAYQKATYLRGSEQFNKEEYADAVSSFEKSLQFRKDPNYTALSSFWAAEAYSIGRRYEEALRHYQTVVGLAATREPELTTKARYGMGYAHYNLLAYDQALTAFKTFTDQTNKSNPNYTDALVRLADCYYVTKQYQPALDVYTRARTIGSPDNDYILLQSGTIQGILRKYSDARTDLTALVKSYPTSQYRDEAFFQRAQFEIEQGNYQAAIDGLTQLIRESTNARLQPYAYMRRASSWFNVKQYENTIADYKTVITQFPTHPLAQDALLPLQEALSIAGRSAEFEATLAQFKKANPDNKNLEQIEFETARTLYFDLQYAKALEKLSQFVEAYPTSARNPEARYYIAESHYRLKDFVKALPYYEDLSKDPNFQMGNKVEGRLAEIQFKLGKYETAVGHFRRLEKLASNKKELFNAWSGLMESFYLTAAYDSVDRYARLIIEKGAVNASAHNKATLYLGKSAFQRGNYQVAQDEFLNTVNAAQDEQGAEAKYMIAQILYLQKQYKQSYETLVSLTNDFAAYDEWVGKAYLLMAENFVAMENVFQARATLQSLIDNFEMPAIKDQARARLAELDKQEAAKTQPDTIDNNR